MRSPALPAAKALAPGQRYSPARPPLRRRIEKLGARALPVGRAIGAHIAGLLPLILICAAAMALMWGAALGNSP